MSATEGTARVVLITGAAGGLGSAIARRLAGEGATNLLLCDLSEPRLADTAESLSGTGAQVQTRLVDVTDPVAVESAVAAAVDRFGSLDVMINNAGMIAPNARLHNLRPEDWERVLAVNLMGVVHGMTSALRVMRAQPRGGSIISTASVAGMTAWPHTAPYGAAKAAVIQLTKVAAVEYAREGVRCNCVCPGQFESAMSAEIPAAALPGLAARHPLGLGVPDDLVGAFSYLAGDDSRWTTGLAMVVDGGYSAP